MSPGPSRLALSVRDRVREGSHVIRSGAWEQLARPSPLTIPPHVAPALNYLGQRADLRQDPVRTVEVPTEPEPLQGVRQAVTLGSLFSPLPAV